VDVDLSILGVLKTDYGEFEQMCFRSKHGRTKRHKKTKLEP